MLPALMLFLEFIFCNSASSEKGIPWTSLYCDNRATRLSDCGKPGLRQHYTGCCAAADMRHPSPKDPGGVTHLPHHKTFITGHAEMV